MEGNSKPLDRKANMGKQIYRCLLCRSFTENDLCDKCTADLASQKERVLKEMRCPPEVNQPES